MRTFVSSSTEREGNGLQVRHETIYAQTDRQPTARDIKSNEVENKKSKLSEPAPSAPSAEYSLVRLERVADFVFAVALLLLVVKIDFAPRDSQSPADAYAFLWQNMSQSLGCR